MKKRSIVRAIQRHLVPSFVASAYFFLKYRCAVNPRASVQLTELLTLGRGSVVKAFAIIQTSGGRIEIGESCAVSSFNHISTDQADIRIGNNVRFGPHVTVVGSTRNYRKKDMLISAQGYTHKGIEIGNDVLIGAQATILDGCRIGDGAVVGVASVVSKDVPAYSVVYGSPARVIFKRS